MAEPTASASLEPAPLHLRVLDLGSCDAYTAQAFCESVAVSVGDGASPDTLLLASPNEPYVSVGFHQSVSEELDERFLRTRRLRVIRRVTGGGATWLDPSQVFYEIVLREGGTLSPGPATFARVLAPPVAFLRSLGLPSARLRPPSDLVVGERKISGNAGGTWERALVVQGGLLGTADVRSMSGMLRSPHPAYRALLRREMDRWITSIARETGRTWAPAGLRRGLLNAFRSAPGMRLRAGRPTRAERHRFLTEVLPRHHDPGWWRGPAARSRPAGLLREVRVAGERYVQAWQLRSGAELLLVVREAGAIVEAFETPPSHSGGPASRSARPVPLDDARLGGIPPRGGPPPLTAR